MLLRLGESPSPISAPVTGLLLEHIAHRGQPGVPLALPRPQGWSARPPDHLSALLNEIGVPAAAARGAAIHQQLLGMPAPVVADALGYHQKISTRLRNETGGTWSRCAPGGHGRSPAGWALRGTGDS